MAVAFIGRQAKLTTDRLADCLVGVLKDTNIYRCVLGRGVARERPKSFHSTLWSLYTEQKIQSLKDVFNVMTD